MAERSRFDSALLELAEDFYNSLNVLQRKNRFINVNLGQISLSRLETFVLIELQAEPSRGIGDLANLLRVDRSSVSRALKYLLEISCVKIDSERGERKKRYKISSKGLEVIRLIDERTDKNISALAQGCGAGTLGKVVELFSVVSAALGEAAGVKRPQESAYRTEQRRLSRAFDLLSERAYGSRLPHLSFHCLQLIAEQRSITAATLCQALNAPPAGIGICIKQLSQLKLIRKSENSLDARSWSLSISNEGRQLLERTAKAVAKKLAQALSDFPTREFADLVETFRTFVNGGKSLPKGFRVQELKTSAERAKARAFLIRELVKARREEECPEELLSDSCKSYGLFRGSDLLGVEQWRRGEAKEGSALLLDFSLFEDLAGVAIGERRLRSLL